MPCNSAPPALRSENGPAGGAGDGLEACDRPGRAIASRFTRVDTHGPLHVGMQNPGDAPVEFKNENRFDCRAFATARLLF